MIPTRRYVTASVEELNIWHWKEGEKNDLPRAPLENKLIRNKILFQCAILSNRINAHSILIRWQSHHSHSDPHFHYHSHSDPLSTGATSGRSPGHVIRSKREKGNNSKISLSQNCGNFQIGLNFGTSRGASVRSLSQQFKHVAAVLQVLEQFENFQQFGLSLDPVW